MSETASGALRQVVLRSGVHRRAHDMPGWQRMSETASGALRRVVLRSGGVRIEVRY